MTQLTQILQTIQEITTQNNKFNIHATLIKLTSRKFLIAILTTVTILMQTWGYSDSVIAKVVGFLATALTAIVYMVVEGWKDAKTGTATAPSISQILTLVDKWYDAIKADATDTSVNGSDPAAIVEEVLAFANTTGTTKEI